MCLIYRKNGDEARAYAAGIRKPGRKAIAVNGRLSVFAEVKSTVKQEPDAVGRINNLANSAGIKEASVSWKTTEEQWDRVMEVNLKGYFNVTRQVAPLSKEQKYGKIINVTSINGVRGNFGQSNYFTSKAGIIGYTKTPPTVFRVFNVEVNAVASGFHETPMSWAGLMRGTRASGVLWCRLGNKYSEQ